MTYEAVADPTGSINTTSRGQDELLGVRARPSSASPLAPDQGLAGFDMPGAANAPQAMRFDAGRAPGGSPRASRSRRTDDAGRTQPLPADAPRRRATRPGTCSRRPTSCCRSRRDGLPRLPRAPARARPRARPRAGSTTRTPARLPAQHPAPARRAPRRARRTPSTRSAAGYDPAGLDATAAGGASVLCARCHASNALPGATSFDLGALTHVVHAAHASVIDPVTGISLDADEQPLRLLPLPSRLDDPLPARRDGSAVAADGTLAMQCQSCHGAHGRRSAPPTATGWLDEPSCQSCHTGTATHNNGQIRYTTVFDGTGGAPRGRRRRPSRPTPDTPAPGLSLYRFSTGHGGLAVRGLPRLDPRRVPELPRQRQPAERRAPGPRGHARRVHGLPRDACPTRRRRPPRHAPDRRGLGREHGDRVENGGQRAPAAPATAPTTAARELSDALGDRSFTGELGHRSFFRGARVTCYACHAGPGSDDATSNRAPAAESASATTPPGTPVSLALARERRRATGPSPGESSRSRPTAPSASAGAPRATSRSPASAGPTTSPGRPSTARSTRTSPRRPWWWAAPRRRLRT